MGGLSNEVDDGIKTDVRRRDLVGPRVQPDVQLLVKIRVVAEPYEGFATGGRASALASRNNTFPGEVFLHVAADVLDWCGISRSEPLALEGMQERFLPELAFRGRQTKKLQYSILAAAALRGGTEPDMLAEVAWWQTDDFWQYALYAAVAYIRAAAGRVGVPVRQVCRELARRDGPRPG